MHLTMNVSINYKILENKIRSVDLVLVDLDGVIMTPSQYLCSSHWYVKYLTFLDSKNRNIEFKTTIIDTLYYCMYKTKFKAVDNQLIATLNNYLYNTPIIGLTGRTIDFQNETQNWINKLGMNFTQHDYNIIFKTNQSILSKGILYVGHDSHTALPWDKGEILGKFLKVYPNKPNKILFIDDILRNHKKIYHFCKKNNIEFHGIQYVNIAHYYNNTYSDLDLELIGIKQFNLFFNSSILISDHDAYNELQFSTCTNNEINFV